MPGENEIKHKIVLEGEKEYKSALQDARRNLRTLKSELKAETAELGKNASEQQKAEVKVKSLKKQIQEQEKIVQTCKEQLEAAKKEYADNADVIAKYEIQLNNARAALGNMRSELEGVGQGMKTIESGAASSVVATKSFADAFKGLSDVGGSVSGAIEDIFTGVADTITDLISTLWSQMNEVAQKADNWSDYGTMYGTDAQKIQQYSRAVAAANDSFSDLQTTVNRIVLGGKGKNITELLGISDVNYLGDWDYAMAVMDRLSELRKSGADMSSIYETIFGAKKSEGVMDLVNDWDTIQAYLDIFNGNKGGFGMTDEEIAQMQQVALDAAEIEQKWIGIKDAMTAAFAPKTLEIQTKMSGAMDSLNDYLNAKTDEERAEALEGFKENLIGIFQTLGEAIAEAAEVLDKVGGDFQDSEDGMVRTIGKVMQALSDLLKWFGEEGNVEKVIGGLETLAAFWIAGKGLQMAGKIAEVAANLKVISGYNMLSGASGGANAGASAANAATGGTLWSKIGSILTTKDAKVFGGGAAFLGTLLTPAATAGDNYDDAGNLVDKAGKILQTAEEIQDEQALMAEAHTQTIPWLQAKSSYSADQRDALEDYWDAITGSDSENNQAMMNAWQAVEDAFGGNGSVLDRLSTVLDELYDSEADKGWSEDLPADFWTAITGQNSRDQVTGSDIRQLNGLPGQVAAAVQAGASAGVSGIVVTLDGATVGQLVAPYVQTIIGRDILMPV